MVDWCSSGDQAELVQGVRQSSGGEQAVIVAVVRVGLLDTEEFSVLHHLNIGADKAGAPPTRPHKPLLYAIGNKCYKTVTFLHLAEATANIDASREPKPTISNWLQ